MPEPETPPAVIEPGAVAVPAAPESTNVYLSMSRDDIISNRKGARAKLDEIEARIKPLRDEIAAMDDALAVVSLTAMRAATGDQNVKYCEVLDPDGDWKVVIDGRPSVTRDKTILAEILNIETLKDDEQRKKAIWEEDVPATTVVKTQGNSLAALAKRNIDVALIYDRSKVTTTPTRPSVQWFAIERKPKDVTPK